MVSSRSLSHGFCTKSRAPRRIASTATSTLPHAVITTTGSVGSSAWMRGQQVEPLAPRRRVARVVQVDQQRRRSRRPRAPPATPPARWRPAGSNPSAFSSRRSASRTSGWSSAMRTRGARGVAGHGTVTVVPSACTTQPSCSWMTRCPYEAFSSEWVTWMIVVPSRVEALEQLHDLAALAGVQVAGRLVGEDHLRAGDDRAGDGDQLLLAARELVRVEVLLPDDLEAVEDVADDGLRARPSGRSR